MTNFILATAGHVDHGKSSLVKALTGTDPDRLPEEKARGITIDLGFAELNLTGSNGEKFHVGIVDVPGHEDFVRNMIAGVGSIDLGLLAVAADDGWMPQTEEHLQILIYLGVKRIVVALTKVDLGKVESATGQIREKLKETPFVSALIVSTSVRTGDGIENLRRALAVVFQDLPAPRDIGKPRLFVDRAFSLHGIGSVVTGTLSDGSFQRSAKIFVQPRRREARIRSIQSHGREIETAVPGMRTAINLPDLEIGTDVKRGDVVSRQDFEPASTLDVVLSRSARLKQTPPIKSGAAACVHHGTTRVLGKISLAETDSLSSGEKAVAQLRLNGPLFAFVGDRLIVRDPSEQQTIGGAVVVDLDSDRADFGSREKRGLLESRAVAPDDVALAVWTEVARKNFMHPLRLLERSRFSSADIAAALLRLLDHGEIFLSDAVVAKMLVWRNLREDAAQRIDSAHKKHPERRGLELNELRTALNSISSEVFEALIADLCEGDFVRVGSTVARRTHRATLPPDLKAPAEKIHAILSARPFDPPDRKIFSEDRHIQEALRFLIEQGAVIELNSEIAMLRDSVEQMKAGAVQLLSKTGSATASQLRQKIGTSRRVIIPFLEYLDRIGVTQRNGDLRTLRESKSATVAGS